MLFQGSTDLINKEKDQVPERGPIVLPCLFRHAYSDDSQEKLTPQCMMEVKRVMRERAISVRLLPQLENACLHDLGMTFPTHAAFHL